MVTYGRFENRSPSPEDFARAIRDQCKMQMVMNEIIMGKGYDKIGGHYGLRVLLKERNAREQDLIVHNYDYLNNSPAGIVGQIEAEALREWKVEEDIGGDFEKAVKSRPWNWGRWSLLVRKVNNEVVEYAKQDVYFQTPCDAAGRTGFWWKFGEVIEAVYEGEYEEWGGYYRRDVRDSEGVINKKGIGCGYDSLVEYLVKLWRQKFD